MKFKEICTGRRLHELVMVSYYVHLFVVRLPYISTHVDGYMAKITPVCFWWGTVSLVATLLYIRLYGKLLSEVNFLAELKDYWRERAFTGWIDFLEETEDK